MSILEAQIFSALPCDIVYTHILSKCCIDTRLAFKIPPSRLNLDWYETGDFAETLRYRYAPNQLQQVKGINQIFIPMHKIYGWRDNDQEDLVHSIQRNSEFL